MEDNITFKAAAFGGFDRKDVLDLFEQTNAKHKTEKQALLQQLNKLKQMNSEVASEYSQNRDNVMQKNELIEKMQRLIKKQNADNDKIKQLNLSLEKHVKALQQENKQIKEQYDQLQQDTQKNLERMKLFEESGYSAERILSEANARGAATVAQAGNRASDIISESEKKATDTINEANHRAQQILQDAEQEAQKIKDSVRQYNQQAKFRLNEMAVEISSKEKRAIIKSGELIQQARIQADSILKEAKIKFEKATKEYVQFDKEIANLKLSMQAVLQQIEFKVDEIDQKMPKKLNTDWLLETNIPNDEFLKDEMFHDQLLKETSSDSSTAEDELDSMNAKFSDFDKILKLHSRDRSES